MSNQGDKLMFKIEVTIELEEDKEIFLHILNKLEYGELGEQSGYESYDGDVRYESLPDLKGGIGVQHVAVLEE